MSPGRWRFLQLFVIIHNVLQLFLFNMHRHITLCVLTVLFHKTMQLLGFDILFEPIIIAPSLFYIRAATNDYLY